MLKKLFCLAFALCVFTTFARAQTAEVTIQLNEQFFSALLDALFQNGSPEFPIAKIENSENKNAFVNAKYDPEIQNTKYKIQNSKPFCNETIKLLRETGGVKTSVNLRDGRIYAPIAFTGNYNPPLLGCVEFSGVAETNIVLEFDEQRQALVGRAQVSTVNLNGTGGIGSSVLGRLVQSSIDRKINPIEIIKLDKVSFTIPLQNAGTLKMKAVGIRQEIGNGFINVRVAYQFLKP